MNDFERDVVSVIRSALDESYTSIVNNINPEEIFEFSVKQQIVSLIYYGLKKSQGDAAKKISDKLFQSMVLLLNQSEKQIYESKRLFDELESKGIRYTPLKGIILKELYPCSDMRQMGDVDLLIDNSRYKEVKELMTELGYELHIETAYEYIWKKGNVVFELHKYLFDPENTELSDFSESISYKSAAGSSRYDMSIEDMYIYLVLHFIKHYMKRGAGVRFVIDMYVYMRKYPQMNMEYIRKRLNKLGFYEFYKNIERLIDVWFSDKESDSIVDFITSKLFCDTVYGDTRSGYVALYSREQEKSKFPKLKIFLKAVFPNLRIMKSKYKILNSVPAALPIMWVYHWLRVIFFRRESVKNQLNMLGHMSKQESACLNDEWSFVGLKNKEG